jgi:hypothetical protein
MNVLGRVLAVLWGGVLVVGGGACLVIDVEGVHDALTPPGSRHGSSGVWPLYVVFAVFAFGVAVLGLAVIRSTLRGAPAARAVEAVDEFEQGEYLKLVLRVLGILVAAIMLVGGGGCFVLDSILAVGSLVDSQSSGDFRLGPWWTLLILAALAFGIGYAGFALVRKCLRAGRDGRGVGGP